jgi:hypothetical protein
MNLDNTQFKLELHAYERYCERVEPISKAELLFSLKRDLEKGYRFTNGYLLTGGIWWRASWENGILTLYTCYGRSHLDLPAAVRWAKRYKDRIALG